MERLEAQGRLIAAEVDLLALGDPLEPLEGAPLPSDARASTRALER